jgi:type IV pilus assembly protein PilM
MVGVDIGTSRIKLVELAKRGESVELVRMAVELTPPDTIRDGVVVDPELVAEVLANGLKSGHIKGRQVVAAIAGQGVVVRHVRFPRMPEAELREALKWEGEKYIPFPLDEAVVDFEIMDGPEGAESQEMEVMLVAAQRRIVDSHVRALELAGLKPIAIDVQPFTVLRALTYHPGDSAMGRANGSAATAYLDIGAGTTDIVIAEGQRLRFTRIIPSGGNSFTRAIAERLNIGFEEAERIKIHEAELWEEGPEPPEGTSERARMIHEAVLEVAQDIATDVRRSLDYHDLQLQGRFENAGVTKVIMTGGGSALRGFGKFLESELGLPTTTGDPLSELAVSPRLPGQEDILRLGPMLAVGIGLALREVVPS